MKKYLRLLRVHHYIKNFLVCLAPFFGQVIFQPHIIKITLLSMTSFSLLSSSIYIVNDICDVEKDRKHPIKCKRPIASGEISLTTSKIICGFLMLTSLLVQFLIDFHNITSWLVLGVYLVSNLLYSNYGVKNIPLVDVYFLAFGFTLRVFYGAANTHVPISVWLLLVIICGSLYLGFGKRRNELTTSGNTTRIVLKYYNRQFLSQSMNSCMTLAIVFYSLWCMEKDSIGFASGYTYSVPFIIILFLRYSLIIEKGSDGDPVNVIIKDKILLLLGIIYALLLVLLVYYQ